MAVSTIQSDLEINGNVKSQGDVVISGSIKGNVAAKAVDVKDSGMIGVISHQKNCSPKVKLKVKSRPHP